jgi:hypothetical protein
VGGAATVTIAIECMKIAFCFLTQGDLLQPALWQAFFATAPQGRCNVYCHPKTPAAVTSEILSGRIIRERVATRHGDISIVAATLALFAAALADDVDNQFFVLLSESTIPIVPFAPIAGELAYAGPRSFVSYSVPAPDTEHHLRLRQVAGGARFAAAFYHHEQWVVLHRSHVLGLLDRSPLAQFGRVFAADEHYVMNVLVHLRATPLEQFVNRRTTFVNWRDQETRVRSGEETGEAGWLTYHPKTYTTLSALDLSEARNAWFFRKVTASCDCRLAFERLRQ